jgi:hypothetical protein
VRLPGSKKRATKHGIEPCHLTEKICNSRGAFKISGALDHSRVRRLIFPGFTALDQIELVQLAPILVMGLILPDLVVKY